MRDTYSQDTVQLYMRDKSRQQTKMLNLMLLWQPPNNERTYRWPENHLIHCAFLFRMKWYCKWKQAAVLDTPPPIPNGV